MEPVVDSRHTIWEKFTYLAPFAAFTGAARLPIGPLWSDDYIKNMFLDAVVEVANVARAHGVKLPGRSSRPRLRVRDQAAAVDAIVAADRSAAGQAHRSRGAAGKRGASRRQGRRADADHGGALRGAEAARERPGQRRVDDGSARGRSRPTRGLRTCSCADVLRYFRHARIRELRVRARPGFLQRASTMAACSVFFCALSAWTTPKSAQPFSGLRLRSSQ